MLPLVALISSLAQGAPIDLAVLGASEDSHRPYFELLVFSGQRRTQHVRADELGNYVPAWGGVAYAIEHNELRSAGREANTRKGPWPLADSNFAFAVSPDGTLLATYSDDDATLRLFSTRDAKSRAVVSSKLLSKRGFKVSPRSVVTFGVAFNRLGTEFFSSFPRSGQLSDAGELDSITVGITVDRLLAKYVGSGAPVGWIGTTLVRRLGSNLYVGSRRWQIPDGWFLTTDGSHIVGAKTVGQTIKIGIFSPESGRLVQTYRILQVPKNFLVAEIAAFPCKGRHG